MRFENELVRDDVMLVLLVLKFELLESRKVMVVPVVEVVKEVGQEWGG